MNLQFVETAALINSFVQFYKQLPIRLRINMSTWWWQWFIFVLKYCYPQRKKICLISSVSKLKKAYSVEQTSCPFHWLAWRRYIMKGKYMYIISWHLMWSAFVKYVRYFFYLCSFLFSSISLCPTIYPTWFTRTMLHRVRGCRLHQQKVHQKRGS